MPVSKEYPADGEVFRLTLDGDAPENDPIEMVRQDGYQSFKRWKFKGKKVVGIQTRAFKLVRVGDCRNLDELHEKLAQYGDVPEGQWRQAFVAAYPQSDGRGSVGVADASWFDVNGHARLPYIHWRGFSSFSSIRSWFGSEPGGRWRWLVPAGR